MGIDNNSTVAISIVVKDDGSIALIDAAEGKLVKLQNVSVGAGSAVGKVASGFGLAGANLGTFGTSLSTTTQGDEWDFRERSGQRRRTGRRKCRSDD